MARQAGVILATLVVLAGIATVVATRLVDPVDPTSPGYLPTEAHPWWPDGTTNETLVLFLAGQLGLGLAAFLRRPHSGAAQALLAGSAGNAASSVVWSVGLGPADLLQRSPAWAVFFMSGTLTLVFWSSLVHIVLVFPSRESRLGASPWVIPLVYAVPQLLLLLGAMRINVLQPSRLAWIDEWARIHAAIVSLLLVLGVAGIAARLGSVSKSRRRQIRAVAVATAAAAVATLLLIDVPIALTGAPLLPRSTVALMALPVPILLAATLWRDRTFRLDRLRRSQMALLHAREEERRRLRRDLHDGLGPVLAAVGLKLDAATSYLGRDEESARRLLTEARRDLTSAMSDTRRLVRGLRPPALDELGLVGAVQQLIEGFAGPEGDGPLISMMADKLPPLPAAVEVEAYRIVQEAVTNAVRHAQAQRCEVRISVIDDSLRVSVSDDGVGADDGRSGVGLESMRERAEQLGGECRMVRGETSGTRLEATLPIGESP
jgi:signal transduction histidine kinase